VKNLYDFGLVRHDVKAKKVFATSPLAESALHRLYSRYKVSASRRLSEEQNQAVKGYNMECQVRCRIHVSSSEALEARSFRNPSDVISIECKAPRVQYFDSVTEIKPHAGSSCLWISKDEQFICDGIIVPPACAISPENPVQVIEVSVADPFSDGRIAKIKKIDSWRSQTLATELDIIAENIITVIFHDAAVSDERRNRVSTVPTYPDNTFWVDKKQIELMGIKT